MPNLLHQHLQECNEYLLKFLSSLFSFFFLLLFSFKQKRMEYFLTPFPIFFFDSTIRRFQNYTIWINTVLYLALPKEENLPKISSWGIPWSNRHHQEWSGPFLLSPFSFLLSPFSILNSQFSILNSLTYFLLPLSISWLRTLFRAFVYLEPLWNLLSQQRFILGKGTKIWTPIYLMLAGNWWKSSPWISKIDPIFILACTSKNNPPFLVHFGTHKSHPKKWLTEGEKWRRGTLTRCRSSWTCCSVKMRLGPWDSCLLVAISLINLGNCWRVFQKIQHWQNFSKIGSDRVRLFLFFSFLFFSFLFFFFLFLSFSFFSSEDNQTTYEIEDKITSYGKEKILLTQELKRNLEEALINIGIHFRIDKNRIQKPSKVIRICEGEENCFLFFFF